MYRLFGDLAHRYDLHTPPNHYQHDHAFVLQQAAALGKPCRLLDVGCGTGVLVEKALRAGMLARGIDASAAMIRVAEGRVGKGAAAVGRMQEIDEVGAYDLVVSLSWTLNYQRAAIAPRLGCIGVRDRRAGSAVAHVTGHVA
jgi:predicted TPR repeat methyltransferase